MGQYCGSTSSTSTIQAYPFQERNSYTGKIPAHKEQYQKILQQLVYAHSITQQHSLLASYLQNNPQKQFNDPYFSLMQQDQGAANKLQKMYDLNKRNVNKVYSLKKTPLNVFNQNQLQFSYLSCVFYLLCNHYQLKQCIFVTRNINIYQAYIIRLYCNGKPMDVVIDEKVPVEKKSNNIKYLSTRNGCQQIWPFLLEKAWCKQIGYYDKAKGLSPEDCFEQITGIPASSYAFSNYQPNQNFERLKKSLKKNHWVTFIAKKDQQYLSTQIGLKNRQVFYLQNIQQTENKVYLRTPFLNFTLNDKNETYNKDQGSLNLTYQQILNNFDYYTIGSYVPYYQPQSYPITIQKNKETIYQVQISNTASINIRFIQFYKEYLSKIQQEHYQYSPVILQLYDSKFNLVPECSGRTENLIGLRSSHLSKQDFVELSKGKYYLRLFVDWEDQLNYFSGNFVIYAPRNITVQLKPYKDSLQDFLYKLLQQTVKNSRKVMENVLQELRIKFIEKVNGYLIGIQNLSKKASNFKVSFEGSKNIRINHYPLLGENKILTISLQGSASLVLEVLPEKPKLQYHLSSIDVVKVQN